MKALRKRRMTSIVGALTGTAGALLLAAIVIPSDPLGRSIGALLAASIAVGIAGALVTASAHRSHSVRRGPRPSEIPFDQPSPPAERASAPRMEPMVWGGDRAAPDFVPIASLTEARVARRRVARAPCEVAEA
ncbi:MAG TPA: hypothetical protein VL742_18220 [Casimicrobiaceae bacterium]|nr:hypothetical protein [Casimicrobiaceae bacterium]